MDSLGPESENYFLGLPLHRQLEFLERTWGARPVFSVDMVPGPDGKESIVVSVTLQNMIHMLELNSPPPTILAKAFSRRWDAFQHIGQAYWQWHRSVAEHLSAVNDGPSDVAE